MVPEEKDMIDADRAPDAARSARIVRIAMAVAASLLLPAWAQAAVVSGTVSAVGAGAIENAVVTFLVSRHLRRRRWAGWRLHRGSDDLCAA
jgi:hypothetical protein